VDEAPVEPSPADKPECYFCGLPLQADEVAAKVCHACRNVESKWKSETESAPQYVNPVRAAADPTSSDQAEAETKPATHAASLPYTSGILPRRLSDPLHGFRRFLGWQLALAIVLALIAAGLLVWGLSGRLPEPVIIGLALALLFLVVPLPAVAFVWRILPGRRTNAFFLRSFRHDPRTWPIRKTAQAALGRRFRLSGIRNPSRRWPVLLRWLLFVVFVFRYCTPKYMNLEAGADWKARLWRSLGEARCALIDITDLTPFVREEIRLATACLGLKRILFVADASRSLQEWREQIIAVLTDQVPAEAIQVAIAQPETAAGRRDFAAAVRAFAAALPGGAPGVKMATLPLVESSVMPEPTRRAEQASFWIQTAFGLLLSTAIYEVYSWLVSAMPQQALWALIPALALNGYIGVLVVNYLIDCGSNRERVVTSISLALVLTWTGGIIIAAATATNKVRESAYRAQSNNNLKQIGMGIRSYEYIYQTLPAPAGFGGTGKGKLSWRVAILPYIEEEALYNQFRLDEDWDSPHNLNVLNSNPMPAIYASPRAKPGEERKTYYQYFTGPGTCFPTPFTKARIARLAAGPSNTWLVAEAKTPVEWTRPADIEVRSGQDVELGGIFDGDFIVLYADGWPQYVYKGQLNQGTIRLLVDPDHSEVVDTGRD
jgi:hypothetical protein